MTAPTLEEKARDTFKALRTAFEQDTVAWRLGNTFDTILDYLELFPDDPNAAGFPKLALQKYLYRQSLPWSTDYSRDCLWYDDFSWWGIAALRASRHPSFAEFEKEFRGIADICYQPVYRKAPWVWQNASAAPNAAFFKDWEPQYPQPRQDDDDDEYQIPGGVWNYFWSQHEILKVPDTPTWPGQPGVSTIPGSQNTVTNALFWVLSSRLYSSEKLLGGGKGYLAAATAQYQFLSWWFSEGKPPLLLPNGLVGERVGAFKNGTPTPGYVSDLAWTGDQGLILGGLVDFMTASGPQGEFDSDCLELAKKIAKGVKGHMLARADSDWSTYGNPDPYPGDVDGAVLLPWLPWQAWGSAGEPKYHGAPGYDVQDYATGISVFMRYLLYAFQNSTPELKTYLQTLDYPAFAKANAEFLLQGKGYEAVFYKTEITPMTALTNDLAILVAAIGMN